ncbi:hypothetical protein [Parafilimonas terrae]|uniref:Outer membrane protein beta-barrel family protein n=1 Tax=Parafilimonas terrae TaxID=1465490 RepID=A0A1I5WEB6_9BACT|nr:hypothetical protein [Parafilimonas terrae]SFQ18114.1 hypothetical protein SAMN05444277_106132 [Parafilimonas terrae]
MKNIIISCLLLSSLNALSQDSAQYNNKRLQTDVFTLSACSPNLISIQRSGDNPYKNKQIPLSKLSINVNRFSAFKVENINPLRYHYYINNQSVSQFFDETDLILGNFIKDTADLKINDIEILQFFKSDYRTDKTRDEIEDSKKKINLYKDTLAILNNLSYKIIERIKKNKTMYYDTASNIIKTTVKDKEEENSYNKTKDSINTAWAKQSANLQNETDNWGRKMENQTINNNGSIIFDDIQKIKAPGYEDVQQLIANEAQKTIDNMKEIEKLIRQLSALPSDQYNQSHFESLYNNYSYYSKSDNQETIDTVINQVKKIKEFASNKGFIVDKKKLASGDELEIYRIEEFALNEKTKLAESFVIFSSLQIGKLLQSTLVNCSRFNNEINSQTCLKDIQNNIDFNLLKDSVVYTYIQDVCADLNVLINFLALDNPVFNNTVKNINDNYKLLLKFIKTLDFVSRNNAKEFTLPFSNNLRNIDLIRYSIERKDKLTGKTESYDYDIWVKGGLKVDFSVAILMSQLSDITFNKNPLFSNPVFDSASNSYTSDQRSDSFYLKKTDAGRYNFAFGGMVNLMWRTGASWITPGLSLGIAYGTGTNSKLQFLGSLSLQFGKTERLIAHFGLVAGQQQQLDISQITYNPARDILDQGNTYKVKGDFSTMAVPYNYKFVFKPFFGISYNLSKKNAFNAVGSSANNFKEAF